MFRVTEVTRPRGTFCRKFPMRYTPRAVLATLALLALLPYSARGQDSSALINEALDKPVEVELNTTLPKALQEIKSKTGVPIELSPGVLDLLPWGDQTNLNVKITKQTLRQAIGAISRTLGLVYVLTPESVELRATPALQRLGRRATVEELKILDLLASNSLGLDNPHPTINQLLEAVDRKLIDLKSEFAVEYRAGNSVKEPQAVNVPRNATVADALDAIAKETPLAWGPWGRSVLVKPKEAWVRDRLEQLITRRFVGADVGQVLSDLSDYSGIDFTIEPAAVQRISPQARMINLELQNQSIRQVLETIGGFTGLSYSVNEKGVYLWNQAGAGSGGSAQDPVIAMLPLPDSGIQIMVRQSQVPDDLKQYIRHRFGKEVDKLRAMMKEEGFAPTTQPTTAKADEPTDL